MENLIKWLSNPIVLMVATFLLGVLVGRKNQTAYLAIISKLIDIIEIIDKDIKDIVPKELEPKLTKIKLWIANRLQKKESKIVDNILQNKGYLNKTGV